MSHLEDSNTISLFFEVCGKIEGLCADLYHYYSDIFLENRDVSLMWKKTALEEENHQQQFQLANRMRKHTEFELAVEADKAFRAYSKLQTILKHVQATPPDLTMALSKAIEMEEYLADLHMDSSVRFIDDSMRNMFIALRDFDRDHVRTLKHFLAIETLPKSFMAG